MAQVKLLKIAADGVPLEHTGSADDVTFATYTVTGGGPVLSANLDMNTGTVSDATSYAVTSPASQGLITTVGSPLAFDKIMRIEGSNTMTTAADILFPAVADSAGEVDAFRLPARAGVPTATPTATGEGFLVWDSSGDMLYAWNGSAWTSAITTASSAANLDEDYTADGALAARDVVYISAADKVKKAQADAAGTAQAMGFALSSVSDTDPISVRNAGIVPGFTGLTAGSRYYLSGSSAGAITATVPSTSGHTIVQVGYAKSTTAIQIQFQSLGRRA